MKLDEAAGAGFLDTGGYAHLQSVLGVVASPSLSLVLLKFHEY